MSTAIYYENLRSALFTYARKVAHSNSLGLSNETVNAENLFCEFLNKAFDWNLVNSNENKINQESFDLIDKRKGVAVQITSNKKHARKLKDSVCNVEE